MSDTKTTSTTYLHQDLIAKHKIVVSELKPKTQELISKFGSEKDETKKDAMDEKIYSDVEDYIEDKQAKENAAKKKERFEAAKKEKAAAPAPSTEKKEEPKKTSSFMSRRFGR